jgi:hypothetical protein
LRIAPIANIRVDYCFDPGDSVGPVDECVHDSNVPVGLIPEGFSPDDPFGSLRATIDPAVRAQAQ